MYFVTSEGGGRGEVPRLRFFLKVPHRTGVESNLLRIKDLKIFLIKFLWLGAPQLDMLHTLKRSRGESHCILVFIDAKL